MCACSNNHNIVYAAMTRQASVLLLFCGNYIVSSSAYQVPAVCSCLQIVTHLSSTAPLHLVDDCQLVAATRRHAFVVVSRRSICLADRAFSVAGPRPWNCLPFDLCQSDLTILQLHRALQTFLFDSRFCDSIAIYLVTV